MINLKLIVPIIIIIIIAGAAITFSSSEEITEEITEEAWIRSGSFEMDKSEYNIGEKVFLSTSNLLPEDKGMVQFLRPLNDTHNESYIRIPFDGKEKTQFNYYFEPRFNQYKEICSIDDIAGDWIVKFLGTQYEDINFKIINQTNSWDDRLFEPIC